MSQTWDKMRQMESVRRSINEHMTSVGEEILCVLEKQQRGADVCCVKLVRAFLLERLSAAAEFMFNLFQRETETLQTLLDKRIDLHTADLHPPVCKEEVPLEQQERSPSLVQEEPEPPQIKEEQVELLQRPEEADGSTMTLLALKCEDDGENREVEPVASTSNEHIKTQAYIKYWVASQTTSNDQLLSSRCYASDVKEDTEPVASTSTEHMKTQAYVKYWASQPTSDDRLLSSHRSESNTEDSDDWGETGVDQSALNTLKSHKTQNVEGQRLYLSNTLSQDLESSKQTNYMRSQTGEKSFSCTDCGKMFRHKGALKRHTMVHTGEKPYTCAVCGKGCGRKGNLLKHMMTHTGEKPFTCTVCSKSFVHNSQLKQHMRTHTGEKPFTCTVCGKACSQTSHLKSHMRTHTGEKPFTCKVCGKSWRDMSNLKRHMMTHT